jgi:hypothetical protein
MQFPLIQFTYDNASFGTTLSASLVVAKQALP